MATSAFSSNGVFVLSYVISEDVPSRTATTQTWNWSAGMSASSNASYRPYNASATYSITANSASQGSGGWSYDYRSPATLTHSTAIGSGSFVTNRTVNNTSYNTVFTANAGGTVGSASVTISINILAKAPAPVQLTAPTISGSGQALTDLTFTGGTYSNATSVSTTLRASISSSNFANGGGSNKGSTSPYNITTNDAASPAFYFATLDTVYGNDGNIYYYNSGTILSYPVPAATYSITYDKNGSSVTGTAPTDSTSYSGGETVTLPGKGTMAYTGRTFNGWYISNVSPNYFSAGGTFTMPSSNITVYAQWVANTYTINFDAGGGSVSPTSKTTTYNNTYGSLPTPTRSGYTFNGWFTASSGGTQVLGSDTYLNLSDTTLYAQWSPIGYTVTYDANGGTGAPTSQTKLSGVSLTLTSGTPTRAGYNFSSWNTLANGSGTSYASGASYTVDAAVTLYAQWTSATFTVTLDPNGGSVTPTSKTITNGSLYGTLPTPTRANFTFTGWFTDPSAGVQVTSSSTFNATSDTTIYAQWSASPTYTLAYAANGGASTPTGGTYYATTSITVANAITRTGYSFNGWLRSDTSQTVSAGSTISMPSSDLTLTAQWLINTYDVVFDANGGSGAPATQTKTYGIALTLSSTIPTRSLYTFTGWNTAANGLGTSYSPGGSYTANAGTTLYAQWTITAVTPVFTDSVVSSPATLGVSYIDGVVATSAASYSVYSGALPDGLSLNTSTGALTGTPTKQGSFTFVIRATSSTSTNTDTGSLSITVYPAGKRATDSSTATRLTTAKRFDGSNWVDVTVMKRFDGTNWINISSI